MDAASVRDLLLTQCRSLLTEWEARQNRPWYGRRHQWFDVSYIEDIEFDKEWADYALLAGARDYLDNFVDSMNHGFPKLDNRTWDEAVSELKEITARLEQKPGFKTHG